MSVVGSTPWEPIEPTARMMCMVMRIAQMDQADGCACLVLSYSMWLESDPLMTPELAERLFQASGTQVASAVAMLRAARDTENR